MARPLNMEICRKLEELIRSGKSSRNGLLPPERALAGLFGVGRSVIRNSLFELERQGHVRLIHSRGWYITPSRRQKRSRLKRILVSMPFTLHEKAWEQQAILAALCRRASEFFTEAVFSFLERIADPDTIIEQVRRGELQGIVFIEQLSDAEAYQKLRENGVPCVFINLETEIGDAVGCGMDFRDIGFRAGQLLLDAGHTRIAAVTGDLSAMIFRDMLQGFRDALAERHVVLSEDRIIFAPPSDEESPAVRNMLSRPDRPTAVFAMRDCRSALVCRMAKELNLHVPGDLSVVSYDDITWPGAKEKGLTTFREEIEEMASGVMEMLRDWNLTGVRPQSRKIRAKLIERSSIKSI